MQSWRTFNLQLEPSGGLFSSRFRASAADEHGYRHEIPVDRKSFYRGHLLGEENSNVQAHVGDEVIARILSGDEEYRVEPLWRLRNVADWPSNVQSQHPEGDVIVYKRSDVVSRGNDRLRFCGNVDPVSTMTNVFPVTVFDEKREDEDKKRRKRSTARNTCRLLLVADFRFFQKMGNSKQATTINYLIGLIDRVDIIYKESNWNNKLDKDYGLQIDEILVHNAPTTVEQGKLHYNMNGTEMPNKQVWDVKRLLEQFSQDIADNVSRVCLAHLFTYQDFDQGTLGLAYVGSYKEKNVGGICCPGFRNKTLKKVIFLKTGLTSTKNYGKTILTKEADLVTTHEFGHNFGAEHDNENCAPSDEDGGKYVMYPFAVSGDHPNNKLFSPCSKRAISATLLAKAPACFEARKPQLCGNWRVETGEECDSGMAFGEGDACCTKDCNLRPTSQCSDKNSQCCNNCLFEPQGKLCQQAIPAICRAPAYCDGKSERCPESTPVVNDTKCMDYGRCQGGQCQPFCETVHLESCACSDLGNSCKVCCRETNGTCSPYIRADGDAMFLPNGKPCIVGFCDGKGTCDKTVQDLVERFWEFIEKLDINTFGKFLSDNIVGSVLVFSLVVWVPLSVLVHFVDKKLDKRHDENKAKAFALPAEMNSVDSAPFHIVHRNPIMHQGTNLSFPAHSPSFVPPRSTAVAPGQLTGNRPHPHIEGWPQIGAMQTIPEDCCPEGERDRPLDRSTVEDWTNDVDRAGPETHC
uniref:disintegrin and metalloproteinase domain-containing protein 17-like isoform X2 n=1 Tax=Myxine glutinosa TaxID=7769 RepID=UPI00358E7316